MKQPVIYKRPVVLSIAGYDPCGGAGVLADIKTFEQHRLIGLAVLTANTIQTENSFTSINWIDEKIIIAQVEQLLEAYSISYVKIGMMPSIAFLEQILEILSIKCKHLCVVWDPVLGATAGKDFALDLKEVERVLPHIFMLTPNKLEFEKLGGLEGLQQANNILLTGGHAAVPAELGRDVLYTKQGKQYGFVPKNKKEIFAKHGSGCVFSSAVTANLALGYPTIKAVLNAKRYTERFLAGNKEGLGYHRF